MRKIRWLLLSYFLGIGFYPADCFAELGGSLTGVTHYIWRGYSKSDDKPAVQANIDYELKSGVYLGAFASSVNFADYGFKDRSNLEFRPYLGFTYKLSNDWQINTEWTRFIYDGKIFGETADYNEFYFYGHFRDLLTANFRFSENSYQQNHMSFNYELVARYPITDSIEISSTIGYNNQKKVLHYDYLYWTSGLTLHFSRNIGIDVRYYGAIHTSTRKEEPFHWQFQPHAIDNRIVFSITAGF